TAWNLAPSGPVNGVSQTAVQFDSSDVVAVTDDSGDASDFFLQVRARRDGSDALKMSFLPAIYAFNSWSGLTVPANPNEARPYRLADVITQPATRIGAGPQRGGSPQSGSNFAGFATFPVGISNRQFLNIAQNAAPGATITIDVVNSTKAPSPNSGPGTHIKGSF